MDEAKMAIALLTGDIAPNTRSHAVCNIAREKSINRGHTEKVGKFNVIYTGNLAGDL